MVCGLTLFGPNVLLMYPLVPFLIMGRVTYIHHYVRGLLTSFHSHALMCDLRSCQLSTSLS